MTYRHYAYMSICLSVYMPICVCLDVYMSICLDA